MPRRIRPRVISSISVKDFAELFGDALKLELVAGESGLKTHIRELSINRPSLAVTGYFKRFGYKRIQVFGAGEMAYLRDLSEARQAEIINRIAQMRIPCMVVSRHLAPTPLMRKVADEYRIPLFRTPLNTRIFTSIATVLLERQMAPEINEHGTLLDVKGIGTLIRGRSGVGKSECALALIERGYSLVADDVVYIQLISEVELLGTSSELNRGYMECRGLGIINIAELFGVRCVRLEKRIDLVITFVEWTPGTDEERTGLEQDYYEILGVDVPHIQLPVRPGRDLARLVEVAAMVQALKLMGHDSAREFNDRLIAHMKKAR